MIRCSVSLVERLLSLHRRRRFTMIRCPKQHMYQHTCSQCVSTSNFLHLYYHYHLINGVQFQEKTCDVFLYLLTPSSHTPSFGPPRCITTTVFCVPAWWPSRGGDVTVYVRDINQPSLPAPFVLFLFLSVSVCMALSTVFRSINSPDNSPLSHSVLLVLFCLIGPFNSISRHESHPQPWYIILCGWLGLKHQLTVHCVVTNVVFKISSAWFGFSVCLN